MITEQRMKANKFNKYFTNDAQNLLQDLGENNDEFQDYIKSTNENSFFLKETEPDEV